MSDTKPFSRSPIRWIEPALVAFAGLIALAIVVASIQAAREYLSVRRLGQTYAQLTGVHPSTQASSSAQRDEMIKRISTNRLIAPPPMQLTGVLGDQAIFNGAMMIKAGQSAGDMKVLSVGPNWITVEKDGQEQKLWVFQSPPTMSAPPRGASPVIRQRPGKTP